MTRLHKILHTPLMWLSRTDWPASKHNARVACETAALHLPKLAEPDDEHIIIPLQNGYLHIEAGVAVLKPHDKSYRLRHVVNCKYAPHAPEPGLFTQFLCRVLPDPAVRARVQEYIGYTLLSDARFQRAQIWIGSGANGKGVLGNILQALHARIAATQLNDLKGFGLTGMLGASLIYCDEAPLRGIDQELLKSLIAGELVSVNRKHKDPVMSRILGKWVILTNHIPVVTDQSYGFWRRLDIVPFSIEIPPDERDPMLARNIIKDELSGVLNWAIEGLLRLLARGRFDEYMPSAMNTALDSAKLETNSVMAWVKDQDIVLGTSTDTSKKEVYGHYFDWCKENGMSPVSVVKFWNRMPDALHGVILEGRKMIAGEYLRTCNVNLDSIPVTGSLSLAA